MAILYISCFCYIALNVVTLIISDASSVKCDAKSMSDVEGRMCFLVLTSPLDFTSLSVLHASEIMKVTFGVHSTLCNGPT